VPGPSDPSGTMVCPLIFSTDVNVLIGKNEGRSLIGATGRQRRSDAIRPSTLPPYVLFDSLLGMSRAECVTHHDFQIDEVIQ
jgi:hypothetical protein